MILRRSFVGVEVRDFRGVSVIADLKEDASSDYQIQR